METFGNEMTLDRYDRWRKGSSVVDPRLTPIGFQQSYRENLYIYIYRSIYGGASMARVSLCTWNGRVFRLLSSSFKSPLLPRLVYTLGG